MRNSYAKIMGKGQVKFAYVYRVEGRNPETVTRTFKDGFLEFLELALEEPFALEIFDEVGHGLVAAFPDFIGCVEEAADELSFEVLLEIVETTKVE